MNYTTPTIGWLESRQQWRARATFETPYGDRRQAVYFPAGDKPTPDAVVALLTAECEQWVAQVAAASVSDEEEVADG